ncbi:MAG: M1 family metallopeptidase [Planctomycetes bacterium]|nr:M1 family metallopeptidase [Planctomycetota bacterium]
MISVAPVVLLLAGLNVDAQHLRVTLDPPSHTVTVTSQIHIADPGRTVRLELTTDAEIMRMRVDGKRVATLAKPGDGGTMIYEVNVPPQGRVVTLAYRAELEEDVAAGEQPGQIHNFSVDAHVGPDGVFLSAGSAWHPRLLDGDGRPVLHLVTTEILPLEGWSFVATGDPQGRAGEDLRRWLWVSPRPVDGADIAGNRHHLHGRVHETARGPVEVVMHVSDEHRDLAPMFVDAACEYLDLYVPRLGAFPYRRFTIVENFFSSGFALPGFTVLGPQVVGMAPRSLAPGYLDHELIHAWWGNGVYVDARDGNWCEALTSYCANYFRRIADEGEDAGRAYRRGILMKLSTDPETLDDGPLAAFGSADPAGGGVNRFVGYDKGAFVFAMLTDAVGGSERTWSALRRFAARHLGRRATWDDLQAAFEAEHPDRPAGWLDGFFRTWVREHTVPRTVPPSASPDLPRAFARQYAAAMESDLVSIASVDDEHVEIDPDFRLYRVLPPEHIVPTIAGTLGRGGVAVRADSDRPEIAAYREQLEIDDAGENLLVIGHESARAVADLFARTTDPIVVRPGSFTVGGKTYSEPEQAVLHTMQHPDRPGRFVTVFHANGDAGWSRLRLIRFYSRDTTIVWSGRRVLERRVFEPDRRLPVTGR